MILLLVLNDSSKCLFIRPCTVANFGPTRSQATVVVAASLLTKPKYGDDKLCNTAAAEFGPLLKEYKEKNSPRWWPWTWQIQKYAHERNTNTQTLSLATIGGISGDSLEPNKELFRGSILLVDRGDCLFEEKAHNAGVQGAAGVIIRNLEV